MRDAIHQSGNAMGPYSDAVRAGPFLMLSGRIGLIGSDLADGVEAQTEAAIANTAAVLEAAGLSLANVVRCSVYLSDMADFELMNAAYAAAFAVPRPARTTVAGAALARGALVEIEMMAYDPSAPTG